jgi:hypothetical protein
MRPHPLWLLLVEDENGKLQDGDLSADQQRPAADASRCPRISGWHLCSLDRSARRAGGNGASASGTAKNASRGSSPEARYLRGLTFADHPESNHEPPALLAALPTADFAEFRCRPTQRSWNASGRIAAAPAFNFCTARLSGALKVVLDLTVPHSPRKAFRSWVFTRAQAGRSRRSRPACSAVRLVALTIPASGL